MTLRMRIDEAYDARPPRTAGRASVADYIPALAEVDPSRLGFALALPDGTVHTCGRRRRVPSRSSRCQRYSRSRSRCAASAVRCGTASGASRRAAAFNSIVQLESEHGIPRNPLINAGAIATTDRLIDGRERRCDGRGRDRRPSCARGRATTASRSTSGGRRVGIRRPARANRSLSAISWTPSET
jgi:glutaminase